MKKIKCLSVLFVAVSAICFMSSCSKDDDNGYKDVTLYHAETYTIPNVGTETWTSDNSLIAAVSGSTVTGVCEGTATISSTKGSFKVTVGTKYNNVTMPILDFGSSMSTIKSKMSGYTLKASTTTGLLYTANIPLSYYMYVFKNSGLQSSSFLCTYSNFNAVMSYLQERFYFVSTSSSSSSVAAAGTTPDRKTICGISVEELSGTYYYLFLFAPYSSSSSARTRATEADIDCSIFDDICKDKNITLTDQQRQEINTLLTHK